uniref:Uncharacterized protein n=2 Tax=Lepeophtheirus salmonis TaxID=72036 RepID=A0A0K2V3N6_LEPSM
MPDNFKSKFPNTRMILDATVVKINKPRNIAVHRAMWSSYKNSNTVKVY